MKGLHLEQFPTKDEATRAAADVMETASLDQDLEWFRIASLGEPVVVRTVSGDPSYWLVPVQQGARVGGFVRVMQDGTVGAIGRFGGGPEHPHAWPTTVTGIDVEEAARRANELIAEGEQASEPMFVHDGPPGREAWLVTTFIAGGAARWIFVTPGFTYERHAGEPLDTYLE